MFRVSGFYENSCTNGEGWRSVIFFSGCPHRCKGCHNPETWDFSSGEEVSSDELYHRVLNSGGFIEGVTLSGGEPFQERHTWELLSLIDRLKSQGLTVWCYTGYLFEDLNEHPLFSVLLHQIDVLIDGPYIEEEFDPELRFRGSSNQRIIDVKKSITSGAVTEYNSSVLERA